MLEKRMEGERMRSMFMVSSLYLFKWKDTAFYSEANKEVNTMMMMISDIDIVITNTKKKRDVRGDRHLRQWF